MKITVVQSRGLVQDPTVNFFKARMRINNVDSDMFVFPEMFCSGYVGDQRMQIDKLEEKIVSKLSELSVNRGSAIICGCPTKTGDDLFDSALVINGKDISEYHKMILSNDGAFDETKVFKAGNEPMIVDHDGFLIGISVGYDLISPELYRFYADNGVHLLLCISAFNEAQMKRFEKIALSRAAENVLPVVLCNMVGDDCGMKLVGGSKYIGADGSIIETCTDSSDVREITIDEAALKAIEQSRISVPAVKLGECKMVASTSGEGANPNPKCPLTGR